MKNSTSLNILCSYAFLSKDRLLCEDIFGEHKNGRINLMIDSGAFSAHNSGTDIKLETYMDFLKQYGMYCEKYVMLDVIGSAEKSIANYETMLRNGLNPMFVCTMFDNNFSYMREVVKQNPNICVAGGVTTKGDWMTKRFQDIYRETGNCAKIHGLGYVTFPKIFQLPLYSIDSSTWKNGQKYGWITWFDQGIKFTRLPIVLEKKKIPRELTALLDRRGVTPKMFFDKNNHSGLKSIGMFFSYLAYRDFQRYAKVHNRDLFLALNGRKDLQNLIYITENPNLKYEEYRKLQPNSD